jgi:hypothetical protein
VKLRTAVILVAVWASTVVGVACVTWQVIHAAGRGVLDVPSGPAITQTTVPTSSPSADSVWQPARSPTRRPDQGPATRASGPSTAAPSVGSTPTPSSRPTSTPSQPSASHGPSHFASPGPGSGGHHGTPTSTPSTPTTPPAPATDTWRGEAGIVTVSCEVDRIRLLGATPSDGYRLEVEQESDEVQVHFEREDPADEVQVVARCSHGVPHFEVEQGDRAHVDSPSAPVTS